MPRILFITALDPEAVLGGSGTATRSIVENLRTSPIDADLIVRCIHEQPPTLPRRVRQIVAVLRSLLSPLPSKSLFDLPFGALRRITSEMTTRKTDLIVFNGVASYPFVAHRLPHQDALIIMHNAEGALYRAQTAKVRRSPIIGRFFRQDLEKLCRLEQYALTAVPRVICLSSEDAVKATEVAPCSNLLVLPTSFSYPPYEPKVQRVPQRPLTLAFLAKYHWWPNTEAVEWLAQNVLDKLAPGSVRVHLYGPGAEKFQQRHPLIIAKGPVAHLSQIWAESDLFICPMVSGSGINIKFIEALYNRQPILATSFTQRGLEPVNDPAVRFLDDPDDWAVFLSSDDAIRLAQRRPSAATSCRFSQSSAASKLAQFLADKTTDKAEV
jgi:hypothetical protein